MNFSPLHKNELLEIKRLLETRRIDNRYNGCNEFHRVYRSIFTTFVIGILLNFSIFSNKK